MKNLVIVMKSSKLNQFVALIFIIFLFAIGWQFRNWGVKTELDQYREQIEQFQHDLNQVNQFADSLSNENQFLLDSLEQNQHQLETLQNEADVLERRNSEINQQIDDFREAASAALDSVPEPVQQYVTALEGQVDSLQEELDTQKHINLVQGLDVRLYKDLYANEKTRADSLQAVMNTFPREAVPNPEKLFGFIPLPSRTVSFISGAATATVGILVLSHG